MCVYTFILIPIICMQNSNNSITEYDYVSMLNSKNNVMK